MTDPLPPRIERLAEAAADEVRRNVATAYWWGRVMGAAGNPPTRSPYTDDVIRPITAAWLWGWREGKRRELERRERG